MKRIEIMETGKSREVLFRYNFNYKEEAEMANFFLKKKHKKLPGKANIKVLKKDDRWTVEVKVSNF